MISNKVQKFDFDVEIIKIETLILRIFKSKLRTSLIPYLDLRKLIENSYSNL